MEHLGDVKQIRGDQIKPVDIITSGSPCQSFSICGSRQGLSGASGLFYEAVRIVREMLEATDYMFPRYLLIENVPGMLNSKRGDDFEEVLNQLIGLSGEQLYVPRSEKWKNSGTILGDRFRLEWRILNAQYFGRPQSRKRVFIVLCLGGHTGGVRLRKYSLSAIGCQGVLRRAKERNKTIHPLLMEVLLRQSAG